MTLSEEQISQFREAAKPLMKFLSENCHPHCRIIIESGTAELVEGQLAVSDPD